MDGEGAAANLKYLLNVHGVRVHAIVLDGDAGAKSKTAKVSHFFDLADEHDYPSPVQFIRCVNHKGVNAYNHIVKNLAADARDSGRCEVHNAVVALV